MDKLSNTEKLARELANRVSFNANEDPLEVWVHGFMAGFSEAKSSRVREHAIEYAEFVWMKESEYAKLKEEYGEERVKKMISVLNGYKGSSGRKYVNDYMAIRNWVVGRVLEDEARTPQTRKYVDPNKLYK